MVVSVLMLSLAMVLAVRTVGADEDIACATVEVVFARGSGQELDKSPEVTRFKNQVSSKVESPLTHNFYELGRQKQNKYQYPAVNVGDVSNGNAIGAWVSRGNANDYGESVSQGVNELIYYMNNRYAACKSTGSKFVLAGYSQGAQVIGRYLRAAPAEIRSAIAFAALFGDPKLHLPEGEGFNPPACRGEQLSVYRRVIASCDVDNGSLGAYKPYLPEDMHSKTGLWCYAHDFICGSSKLAWDAAGHSQYGLEGNAIDSAVHEALQNIQSTVPQMYQHNILNIRPFGDGTTGLDVLFVIDTTASMGGKLQFAKRSLMESAELITALRGRVALVSYRDVGDAYIAVIERQFSNEPSSFIDGISSLDHRGGIEYDQPEAALHALKLGMNGLSWRPGAAKAVILLTDTGFHNPDKVDGTTLEQVVKLALEIDPVNIYPIVPGDQSDTYSDMAGLTNGQVIINDNNPALALLTAIDKLEQRPVALLKNLQYYTQVGQQVTFDASDSYVENATITQYSWDFDGDGVYELHTTEPVVKHTYGQLFDGNMQVRLTASNNTIASASASVKIGTYTPLVAPATPIALTITQDYGNEVAISWQPADNLADSWIVSSDGIALGRLPASTTDVTVGDMVRNQNTTIEVAAMMADGTMGTPASVAVSVWPLPSQPKISNQSTAVPVSIVAQHGSQPNILQNTEFSFASSSAVVDTPLWAGGDIASPSLPVTDTLGAAIVNTEQLSSNDSYFIPVALGIIVVAGIVFAVFRLRYKS